MRILGLLGLVLTLLIVGLLVRQQLAASRTAAAPLAPIAVPGASAPANGRDQARQIEQQFKQALEAAQQQRAMPDEAK